MKNFADETVEEITRYGYTLDDIRAIGSEDCYLTVEQFLTDFNVEYRSGSGEQEMPCDIVVLFNDGTWLERAEYDGSEWWEYKSPPYVNLDVQFVTPKNIMDSDCAKKFSW